ncbi:MAG TPA: glutamate 5-kinase [Candidatus Nanoarchaeia archaeon]|nr:glutamate 5-kinase [Candidatus Nanoarchaeia archaeon]
MRIVIKIGTNLLTKEGLCGLRKDFIKDISKQIANLREQGHTIVIVTSGAIGAGCTALGVKKPRDMETKQALAAIGQSAVMGVYHDAFAKHKIQVAQILLTYQDFSDRRRYLNLSKAIERLFELKVLPIINENDPISVDEITATFGDNDKLSALVASKINADMLIILSDIDGLYTKNPRLHADAVLIPEVSEITKEIEMTAGRSGSAFSVGGMITKLQAAKIASESGCTTVICNGRKKGILQKALDGKEGTLFRPKSKISNKERWIKFAKPAGRLFINKCAEDVLLKGKVSLLAIGLEKVTGSFDKKDVVEINSIAKGISEYSSEELMKLKGIKDKVIIKSENIVLL